jgi:hypothetical protein
MRKAEHRPRRRIERRRRQQVEPDTGAEVVGTNVSVEDEYRDQDRDRGGSHPPERAAREDVVQTERLRRAVLERDLAATRAGEHVGIRSEALNRLLTREPSGLRRPIQRTSNSMGNNHLVEVIHRERLPPIVTCSEARHRRSGSMQR